MRLLAVTIFFSAGCLSSSAYSARHRTEVALDRARAPSYGAPGAVATASCSDLARAIATSHPRVAVAFARARAALARSNAEGSLPPPTASIEVWDFPVGAPSRADDEGMYMFGIGQEFPPGRSGRALSEAEDALALLAESTEMERGAWAETAHACVAWSTATIVHAQMQGHLEIVSLLREAVLSRYRGGATDGLTMIAQTESEIAAAARHVAEAEEEVRASRDLLVAFASGSVALPEEPPMLAVRPALPPVNELVERALSSRGTVVAGLARAAGAQARLDASDSEAETPTFELRATYMQSPSMRPGVGAMVSMSLPWLSRASSTADSTRHMYAAARADVEDIERSIRVEVVRASGRVRVLTRSLALLMEQEVPAATRAIEAARASLTGLGFDVAAWIEAAHALRLIRVDEARTRAALEEAWVELEAAVGQPIAAQPIAPQPTGETR